LFFLSAFSLTLTLLPFQNIIKLSQSKDQFLRVSLKRLTETQIHEDELQEVNELNKVILDWNQELETQLADKSREKACKWLLIFLEFNHA
jgi:hypothetical protein